MDLFFVFDVESIGLQGPSFAVGVVVIERTGKLIEEVTLALRPEVADPFASKDDPNMKWVRENCPALEPTHGTWQELSDAFWALWMKWKAQGAVMAADCAWPVEARFLQSCVNWRIREREWQGPYPLIDIGSVLLAGGRNPLGQFPRLENEMPAHHPLHDARQSARLLVECLNGGSPR